MLAPSWNPTTLEDGWITPNEPTPDSLWDAISGRLREVLSETTYDTWLAHAEPRSLGDGRLVVAVPNEFTRDWIESHFRGFVSAAARESSGRDHLRVSFVVGDRGPTPPVERPARRRGATAQGGAADRRLFRARAQPEVHVRHVHHRLVEPLRTRRGTRGCGGAGTGVQPALHLRLTGLGKTHLLQAIGHYVSQHSRRLTRRYVTSETFMNDFIDSLARQAHRGLQAELPELRRPPDRRHPVLRGEGTDPGRVLPYLQLALRRRRADHHLVRPAPREIATLEERLRSRFEWGLLTDIQPPDLETRIAILRKKVNTERIAVTDPEVLTFIASRVARTSASSKAR